MDNIIVKTKCGDVKGYKVNDVFKFQGIPFAEKADSTFALILCLLSFVMHII